MRRMSRISLEELEIAATVHCREIVPDHQIAWLVADIDHTQWLCGECDQFLDDRFTRLTRHSDHIERMIGEVLAVRPIASCRKCVHSG